MIGHITKTKNRPYKRSFKYSSFYGSAYHWTHVLRHPDKEKRELIAKGMELAIEQKKWIRYSNGNKSVSLFDALKVKFKIKSLHKRVYANCCNLVSVCCRYAGLNTPRKCDSRTVPKTFKGFTRIKYKNGMKLKRGDILVSTTMPKCHTAVYLGD